METSKRKKFDPTSVSAAPRGIIELHCKVGSYSPSSYNLLSEQDVEVRSFTVLNKNGSRTQEYVLTVGLEKKGSWRSLKEASAEAFKLIQEYRRHGWLVLNSDDQVRQMIKDKDIK